MSTAAPLLRLEDVSLRVGDELSFSGISLSLAAGESVGLVVPRGRTSLLLVAAGLLRPDSGEVFLDGVPIDRAYRDLAHEATTGFVFQNGGLLVNTSLSDNIALPLRYHTDLDEDEISKRVSAALAEVGLLEDATRFPYQVTRGAQRLASLARALAVEPALVYVDDLHHGATVDIWERFVAVMKRARERWGTSFLSGLPAGSACPPGVDRLVHATAALNSTV